MEKYRVKVTENRTRIKNEMERKIRMVRNEYTDLDQQLEADLQLKAHQVEARRERISERERILQNIVDGLTAVLDSYHPTSLATSEEQLLEQSRGPWTEERTIDFRAPELIEEGQTQESVIGLQVIDYRPILSLTYLYTIPGLKGKSRTVCFPSRNESLIHGGENYIYLNHLSSTELKRPIIDCIRMDGQDKIMVLQTNTDHPKKCVITLYTMSMTPGGIRTLEQISCDETLYPSNNITHFTVVDGTLYQTIKNIDRIFVLDPKKGPEYISKPTLNNPRGICQHDLQVYIACADAIMTFNHDDPTKAIRKFASVDCLLSGIQFHRHHLFTLEWSTLRGRLLVFNMTGVLVKDIELPETGGVCRDISISEKGVMAVASENGPTIYQLDYDKLMANDTVAPK